MLKLHRSARGFLGCLLMAVLLLAGYYFSPEVSPPYVLQARHETFKALMGVFGFVFVLLFMVEAYKYFGEGVLFDSDYVRINGCFYSYTGIRHIRIYRKAFSWCIEVRLDDGVACMGGLSSGAWRSQGYACFSEG